MQTVQRKQLIFVITPYFNFPVAQTIASFLPHPPLPQHWEQFFAEENAEAQRRLEWDVDNQMDWEYHLLDSYPSYEEDMFEAQEPEPPVSLAEFMLITSHLYN